MNVADLLQEAPSDKRRPPQREQLPPLQPQERPRDRQSSSQGQQPAQQHTAHPTPHQHNQQASPPQSYNPPAGSRHSRPSSPPRSHPQDFGSSHSQQSQQRLPPPSAIFEYEARSRRPEPQPLPPPHELTPRSQHGPPPPLGPPGSITQQYAVDHHQPSSRSQSRSSSHSHSHHHHHSHGHPASTPSSMYMPPPTSRNSHHSSSKHGGPPSGPGMAPPPPGHGHGSIPLYPTPVGPGMGPPPHHMEGHSRAPPGYNEPSAMYNAHAHAPPGASIIGALPLPPSHSHPHSHSQPPMHSRHRRTGSGGYISQGGSPAMGSLQRSPYDERDAGRGGPPPPPSQIGGAIGPGQSPSLSREPSSASLRNGPHMLTGPGSAGMHVESMSGRERERYGREREREERSMERRERELRDRDRMERDQREREKYERIRERERREDEKMREREAMAGVVGPDGLTSAEREREWQRRVHPADPHAWPRFANPHPDDVQDREMQRRMEWEREREIVMIEEKRARDVMERERSSRQVQSSRTSARERDQREKERLRESEREGRREKYPDQRRIPSGEHGWFPEPHMEELWAKEEREREREYRDRLQRERDRDTREAEQLDAARASRQGGPHPSHHHHHVRHNHSHRHQHPTQAPPGSSQGHSHSKATKMIRPTESGDMTGPSPMGPGGMPPPFPPMMSDLPPQQPGLHKSMSKSSLGPGQPSHPPMPPQHLHPSHRLHPHPSHVLGNPPPMAYGRRPSPPPFAAAHTGMMQSRSPRPPLLPTVPPLHIGTFIYPRTPFPFLDFPSPPDTNPSMLSPNGSFLPPKEIREIRATIYIPSGFLPTRRPRQLRIWGGAPIPSFSPLFSSPQLVHHMQSGMPYGNPKPHPYELHGSRRVYTDDSDLFLCALHAGLVTWSLTREARDKGKDLRLEVRLTREARFVGGLGSRYLGQDMKESVENDDGSTLLSAGWGNSHDGAGVEILRAEFVEKGTAHKPSLKNRSQRLAEYNERSVTLGCAPPARKRKRRATVYDDDEDEASGVHDAFLAADAKLCSSRTFILGYQPGTVKCGFKYDADTVKSVLFPFNADSGRPSKKRRLANSGLQMRVNGVTRRAESPRGADDSVVIETLTETFLISPQTVDAQDKENAAASRRYTVALVNRKSSKPTPKRVASQPKGEAEKAAPAPAGVQTDTSTKQPIESATSSEDSAKGKTSEEASTAAGVPKPTLNGAHASTEGQAENKAAEDATVTSEAADTKTSPEPSVPASKAASTGGSSTPMDLETPEPRSEEPTTVEQPALTEAVEPAAMDVESKEPEAKEPVGNNPETKDAPPVQVLQRNLGEDDLLFDVDGISILGGDVLNGMRTGWKIEARTWRWADESLISLAV